MECDPAKPDLGSSQMGIWGLRMRGLACAHGVVTEARPGDAASDTEAPTGTGPRAERALGDCELVARAVSTARNICEVHRLFAMGPRLCVRGPEQRAMKPACSLARGRGPDVGM
jgi:hypothetical protein